MVLAYCTRLELNTSSGKYPIPAGTRCALTQAAAGDNYLLELAAAAGDAPIVTFNRRDFCSGELRFAGIMRTLAVWPKS
jgi:hypothetical protein